MIVITVQITTTIGRKMRRTQSATENPGMAGESRKVGLINKANILHEENSSYFEY